MDKIGRIFGCNADLKRLEDKARETGRVTLEAWIKK